MVEIGKDHGEKTPGQVALNWIICKGGLPIPGAKTAAQAQLNVGAIGWRLTPEEIKALDAAGDKITWANRALDAPDFLFQNLE